MCDVEIVAAVLRGVESGTIEGEVLWMMPEKQDHLRGTLWSGPPMTLKGYPVVVIPLPKEEK